MSWNPLPYLYNIYKGDLIGSLFITVLYLDSSTLPIHSFIPFRVYCSITPHRLKTNEAA